jgi:hypothetical protein
MSRPALDPATERRTATPTRQIWHGPIDADEGIVADRKQVDQVLDLTDGTGAEAMPCAFQTAIDDLDAARIRGHRR